MPKLIAVTALAIGAVWLAAPMAPASAQVMKNFSWKKKPAKMKPQSQDAEAAKPAETGKGQTPKRRKTKPGN